MHVFLLATVLLAVPAGPLWAITREFPLHSPVLYWYYNPQDEPGWLEGLGRQWVTEAMQGWEGCGVRFVYKGTTELKPGEPDRVNVVGWGQNLGQDQRGQTSGSIRRKRGVAMERDVALASNRPEFELQPRLLRKVIAHEIGHVVGLDHSGNCYDVMGYGADCPQVEPEALPIAPTDNDLQRCKALYGR